MSTAGAPISGPPQPQDSAPGGSAPLSWEGDKMFNIYIYDYCFKRGFRKTARELLAEAEIPAESTPPINARQGLLFEWWSVFWVLFQAKSSGQGTEDALLYTQHQLVQQANRQQAQRIQAGSGPLSNASLPLGQGQAIQQPPLRLTNGMGMNRQGSNLISNGQVTNGSGPSVQPGGLSSFPMSGPGPQSNGLQGGQGMGGNPGQLNNQAQSNFTSLLPGQRPPLNGPQQRLNGPFQSPTMSHSPQNTGGPQQHQHLQQQHPQQHQQQQQLPHQQQSIHPVMNQLGPSPHISPMMRGGMHPPGVQQGMDMMNPGQQSGSTQGSGYQQRPPSRTNTNTPGQGGMMLLSPSMTARQPPGNGLVQTGALDALNADIMQIPSAIFTSLKQELGMADKELQTLTHLEKQRLLQLHRQRIRPKPGDNAAAGPSSLMSNQQQRNQQQAQPQVQRKRNSTSPGEEHESIPRTESSPPERKRIRRSPMDQQQQPSLTSMLYPHQQTPQMQHQQQSGPPQQGGPGQQQNQSGMVQSGMMMMRGMAMTGGPLRGGQMGALMGMPPGGQPSHHMNMQPQSQAQMNLGPQGQSGMNSQMNLQQMTQSYRHSLHTIHKQRQQANTGQAVQNTSQNKPGVMMPPPSPAMNGPPKDTTGSQGKDSKMGNGQLEESPRVLSGTAPPTPAPALQGQQNLGQQQQNANGPPNSMAASPSSMVGGGSSMNAGPPAMSSTGQSNNMGGIPSSTPNANVGGGPLSSVSDAIFPEDFIHSVARSLGECEFDFPPDFRPDGGGDINFERDFGQWFNPDDVGGLDGIK